MPGPSSPHLQLHPFHPLHQPQLLSAAPAARHAPLLLAGRPACQSADRGRHQSPLAPAAGDLMERRQRRRPAGESGGPGGHSAAAAASAPGDGSLVGRARLCSSRWVYPMHCKENPIFVFLFWELRGLSPNFHIYVSVSDLFIPRIGPHISLQQNRQTDPGNILV